MVKCTGKYTIHGSSGQFRIMNSLGICLAVLFEPGIKQALFGWCRWGVAFLSSDSENLDKAISMNHPVFSNGWNHPSCFCSISLGFSWNDLQLCELKKVWMISPTRNLDSGIHPNGDTLSATMLGMQEVSLNLGQHHPLNDTQTHLISHVDGIHCFHFLFCVTSVSLWPFIACHKLCIFKLGKKQRECLYSVKSKLRHRTKVEKTWLTPIFLKQLKKKTGYSWMKTDPM